MSNTFGKLFCITTWGESHGVATGVVIDGCPAGLSLSVEDIQKELDLRRPGKTDISSPRQEKDKAEILSGVFEGGTIGTPISILIKNEEARSIHYEKLKNIYRPGHADYSWDAKYGVRDWRGGGRASARETVARVAGGAVAKKILIEAGIEIVGYVSQISKVKYQFSSTNFQLNSNNQISNFKQSIENSIVRCPDAKASKKMIAEIEKAKKAGDSVGGIVEVVAFGVQSGLGEPVFDKLSADLAKGLMSIPGAKGVEIGSGFDCVLKKGSEHNDVFQCKGGKVITATNNAGGLLGGISNGMPIVARIALKPTSSINKKQSTVNDRCQKQKFVCGGRHDPCIVPRAAVVVEAMMALVLVDNYLINKTSQMSQL